jgi:hypothetical protein
MDGPLYADDSQKAVLGSVLLDGSLLRGPVAELAVSDFVGSADRAIYGEMLRLSEDGKRFDEVTLAQTLSDRRLLENVEAYIGSLIDGAVPDHELVKKHVEKIQRLSKLRRLQKLHETLGSNVTKRADPDRLLQVLDGAVQSLKAGYDLDGDFLPYAPRDLSRRPELVTLSQVEAKEVNWLWRPYLPCGMLAMLSGDPGAGKTFVALAVSAAVTVGRVPFTGEPRTPADVLYLSVENSPEHVLRPRFDLLGGDPSRFHLLRGSVIGQGKQAERGSVKLSDVQLLSDAFQRTQAHLIIVDPIQSYLGANVDAHRSNETRPILDQLARLAEENKACVLLVRHLSKSSTTKAIHRGLGSIDFTGAVRTELLVGSLPDDPSRRALVQVKSNLGQLGKSLGYSIERDGSFRWTGETQVTAGELLAAESAPEEQSEIERAGEFLSDALAGGFPLKVKELEAASGVNERTLRRAAKRLGVQRSRDGEKGPWLWTLPEHRGQETA